VNCEETVAATRPPSRVGIWFNPISTVCAARTSFVTEFFVKRPFTLIRRVSS
jgi:hypothetical protein